MQKGSVNLLSATLISQRLIVPVSMLVQIYPAAKVGHSLSHKEQYRGLRFPARRPRHEGARRAGSRQQRSLSAIQPQLRLDDANATSMCQCAVNRQRMPATGIANLWKQNALLSRQSMNDPTRSSSLSLANAGPSSGSARA